MKSTFYLTLVAAIGLSTISSPGQRSLDMGVFFGVSHYMGDLQRSHIEVLELHQARGLFLRYNTGKVFSLRAHLYQGTISGDDGNYPTIEKAWQRNLSFRSHLYEVGLVGELNFLNFGMSNRHGSKRLVGHKASAYLFGGVAGFHFNPQALYDGQWHNLQPLGTEGQGMEGHAAKYQLYQIALPLGFGFKIRPGKFACFGVEVGFRKTFTDYLDDVSGHYPDRRLLHETNPLAAALSWRGLEADAGLSGPPEELRGNPAGKDMYLFAGLSLAITLGK